MNTVIETKGLQRRFGENDAVRDLNLSITRGSIFALLGPNGAGKTTTIKMLMNILLPTEGEARVLGMDSRELGPDQFQRIGYVSENQEMPGWMTLRQLIDYLKPLYPAWDDAFCGKLLDQFQLPLDRKLKHLSRGMKMKVALLSSLAYRPQLLILDEPFSGLDPLARDEFISGILELVEDADWTILISSHDIGEVERLVDWVGYIDDGSMRLCEPAASLQARFRRVEVVLSGESLNRKGPPPLFPANWQSVETGTHAVRFVDSSYDANTLDARVREHFPDTASVEALPMSLREIFVSLARHHHKKTSDSQ